MLAGGRTNRVAVASLSLPSLWLLVACQCQRSGLGTRRTGSHGGDVPPVQKVSL